MASDYWEQQFREADRRAALLDAATVPELVDLYHACRDDLDFGSRCFQALQRRPHAELWARSKAEARSTNVARRAFAADLVSMATSSSAERRTHIPMLMRMLSDNEPEVTAAAIQALGHIQSRAHSSEEGRRIRATGAGSAPPRWDAFSAVFDVSALERFVRSDDAWVRMALADSLMFCSDETSTAMLIALTHDDDSVVRSAAVAMLGWRSIAGGRVDEAIQRLWELVQDLSRDVRCASVTALVKLGERAAEPLAAEQVREAVHDARADACTVQSLVWLLRDRPLLLDRGLIAEVDRRWGMTRFLGPEWPKVLDDATAEWQGLADRGDARSADSDSSV